MGSSTGCALVGCSYNSGVRSVGRSILSRIHLAENEGPFGPGGVEFGRLQNLWFVNPLANFEACLEMEVTGLQPRPLRRDQPNRFQ